MHATIFQLSPSLFNAFEPGTGSDHHHHPHAPTGIYRQYIGAKILMSSTCWRVRLVPPLRPYRLSRVGVYSSRHTPLADILTSVSRRRAWTDCIRLRQK